MSEEERAQLQAISRAVVALCVLITLLPLVTRHLEGWAGKAAYAAMVICTMMITLRLRHLTRNAK